MRLIDADALIDKLPQEYYGSTIHLLINDAPTIPAEFVDWIPCSKGLPKAEYGESDCVWTTCCWKSDMATRWIEKLYFNGGNWCYPTGECFTHKVIAWMPSPKPYKGGDSK